jgi:hypothetical protein
LQRFLWGRLLPPNPSKPPTQGDICCTPTHTHTHTHTHRHACRPKAPTTLPQLLLLLLPQEMLQQLLPRPQLHSGLFLLLLFVCHRPQQQL